MLRQSELTVASVLRNTGERSRFSSLGSFRYALAISVSMAARMIHPPCQISATSAGSIFHLNALAAVVMREKPCAKTQSFAAVSACLSFSSSCVRLTLPSSLTSQPGRSSYASMRSSLREETILENTASAIVGVETLRSNAASLVHLPVPFCPAVSRIISTR